MIGLVRLALAAGALALIGAAEPPGTVTVEVGNVRSAKGRVHVDICPEAQFLGDGCSYAGVALARCRVGARRPAARGAITRSAIPGRP